MNKFSSLLFLFACLILLVNAKRRNKTVNPLNQNDLENHWSEFKSKHSKKFKNSTHENRKYILI